MAGRIISRFQFALNADARTFNREMKRGEKNIDDQERAFRQLQRTVRTANQRFDSFRKNVISLRGALIGVAAIGGFLRLAKESTEAATALVELSDRTGFATDRLQTLSRVFEGDGVTVESFSKAIDRMNRTLNDAELGLSTARDALGQVGLTFNELKGLRPEEQFDKIAKGISELSTESERAGVVQNIFGRGAQGFVNVLQRGTEALREQEEAFRALGITSEQGLRSLKALNQEFTNISTTLQVSLQQSFADSADELRDLLVELQELIKVATPITIQGVSGFTGGLTSIANNTDALAVGAGAYLGGKGAAAVATQISTLATAFGSGGTSLAARVAAFSARLAGILGPTGVLVGIGATLVVFRDQITSVARSLGLIEREASVGGEARAGDTSVELEKRLNDLKLVLDLDRTDVFSRTEGPQENLELIRQFVRELNLREENEQQLIQALESIRVERGQPGILGAVTSSEERTLLYLENYQDKLEEVTKNALTQIISDTESQLEIVRRNELLASQNDQSLIDALEAARQEEEATKRRLEEEQRIAASLQRQETIRKASIDGQYEAYLFAQSLVEEEDKRTVAMQKYGELLKEQDDLLKRINSYAAVGLGDEAQALFPDLEKTTQQILELREYVFSLKDKAAERPSGPLILSDEDIRKAEELGEAINESINSQKLQEVHQEYVRILNTLGLLKVEAPDIIPYERLLAIRNITQGWLEDMKVGLKNAIIYTENWGQALERLGRLAITSLLSNFLTGDNLKTLFGRQFGGHVNVGQPYVVGEAGPEIFVPKTAGDIIPNNQIGGGVNITFAPVIQSTDGPGVRNALNQVLPMFKRDIIQTINNQNAISLARSRQA